MPPHLLRLIKVTKDRRSHHELSYHDHRIYWSDITTSSHQARVMAFFLWVKGQEFSSRASLFTSLDLVNDIVVTWLPQQSNGLQ